MPESFFEKNPLLGESESFISMLEKVSKLAQLNRPVLIVGERGTGKELIAARFHYLSKRWGQTFVKINCSTGCYGTPKFTIHNS